MKIARLRPEARADLISIGECIAEDSPDRAVTFVRELRAIIEQAAKMPMQWPAREELPGLPRVAAYGRYRIYFAPPAEGIVVLRVLHAARDVGQILSP